LTWRAQRRGNENPPVRQIARRRREKKLRRSKRRWHEQRGKQRAGGVWAGLVIVTSGPMLPCPKKDKRAAIMGDQKPGGGGLGQEC